MKKYLIVLVSFIMMLLVMPNVAQSQVNEAPNNVSLFRSWAIPTAGYADSVSVKAYASRLDTLHFRYWINRTNGAYQSPVYIRVGGASRTSITLDVTDTSSIDIVVKSRTRSQGFGAASAWTTILDDSLQCTGASASSGLVKEFSLTDTDSDLFDAVDTEIIIIRTVNAHTLGVSGNERVRTRLNWVP